MLETGVHLRLALHDHDVVLHIRLALYDHNVVVPVFNGRGTLSFLVFSEIAAYLELMRERVALH